MDTVRDQIAVMIERGRVSDYGWHLNMSIPERYDNEERRAIRMNIAQFVRDGVMSGSFPQWTFTTTIDLDLDGEQVKMGDDFLIDTIIMGGNVYKQTLPKKYNFTASTSMFSDAELKKISDALRNYPQKS